MLLQFIPGPGAQLSEHLARLGTSLGQIINPGGAQRQAVRAFLLENPEILASVAAAQRTAEEQQRSELTAVLPELADARQRIIAQAPEEPNVMEALGFSPRQTREILQLAPVTIGERINRLINTPEFAELGAEAQTEAIKTEIAEARAGREEAAERLEAATARRLVGIPQLQASLMRAAGDLEMAMTGDRAKRFAEWITVSKDLPPGEKFRLRTSEFALEYLRDIQFREKLSLEQLLASLRAARDPLERSKDKFLLMEKFDSGIKDLIEEAKEADETRRRMIIGDINDWVKARREALGDEFHTFLAVEDVSWLGRNRIRWRTFAPETLNERFKVIWDGAVEQAAQMRAAGASEGEIRRDLLQTQAMFWGNLTPDQQEEFMRHVEQARLIYETEGVGVDIERVGEVTGRAVRGTVETIVDVFRFLNPLEKDELTRKLESSINEFLESLGRGARRGLGIREEEEEK